MPRDYHKPTRFEPHRFDAVMGGEDPARIRAVAHDTARALLDRARQPDSDDAVDRMLAFADEHGIDAIAELWAHTAEDSLPGALWRLYLLRALIRQDPEAAANAFRRGVETLATADEVIAGAPRPAGPEEIVELVDRILRGAFSGDLADALERAAACCRILAAGTIVEADASDLGNPERATALTTRAARLSSMAAELRNCARLERSASLD